MYTSIYLLSKKKSHLKIIERKNPLAQQLAIVIVDTKPGLCIISFVCSLIGLSSNTVNLLHSDYFR